MAKTWLYGLISLTVISLVPSIGIGQIENFQGNKRINGISIFLTVRGKGDPLLLIHGGPGLNHSYFIPYLASLEKEFTIIYYDQRACGRSSTPSADSISMKFLADDIDAIRKELKIEKLKILGHSKIDATMPIINLNSEGGSKTSLDMESFSPGSLLAERGIGSDD